MFSLYDLYSCNGICCNCVVTIERAFFQCGSSVAALFYLEEPHMTNEIAEKNILFTTRITVTRHPLYSYIKDSYINIREGSVDGVCFDPENFTCHEFSLPFGDIDRVHVLMDDKGIVNIVDKSKHRYYIQAIEKEQQVVDLIAKHLKAETV